MKKIVIIIAFVFAVNICSAQCANKNIAFKNGEKLTFQIYYNWGFIWLNTGVLYFTTDSLTIGRYGVYHLKGHGYSYKEYDWFYKVRDTYESYVETESFLPLRFWRDTYEGGYKAKEKYKFDYKKEKIYTFTETSGRPYKEDTLDMPYCAFDVMTALYYCRNLDFSQYKGGEKIPITCIIDNQEEKLYIRYVGKEVVEDRENNKYRCIKFKAKMVEGSIFKGGEDLTAWITDDKNRIPIMVKAEILVGAIKAYLTETENLRHKISSKVE